MARDWSDAAAARLRMVAREWGTQDALSEASGVPKATLQRILKGQSDPGTERLDAICSRLGVSADYILNGDSSAAATLMVDVYDVEAAAGHGRHPFQDAPIGRWPFPKDWTEEKFGESARLKMLRVSGDSQEPELSDGDSIIIDQSQNRLTAGMHVVRLDDTLLIKRVQPEGRFVRLVSNNKAYRDVEIDLQADADRFEVIGRAVWAGKLL